MLDFSYLFPKLLIALGGIGAIVYGYWRSKNLYQQKEKQWYTIGLLVLLALVWDLFSTFQLRSFDPHMMFWSRTVVYLIVILIGGYIYKKYELE